MAEEKGALYNGALVQTPADLSAIQTLVKNPGIDFAPGRHTVVDRVYDPAPLDVLLQHTPGAPFTSKKVYVFHKPGSRIFATYRKFTRSMSLDALFDPKPVAKISFWVYDPAFLTKPVIVASRCLRERDRERGIPDYVNSYESELFKKDADAVLAEYLPLHVFEAGAGLAWFTPELALAKKAQRAAGGSVEAFPLPVVGDVFDYREALTILRSFAALEPSHPTFVHGTSLQKAISLAETYTDPTLITLHSVPLGTTPDGSLPEELASLAGTMDVVVDFYGPRRYRRKLHDPHGQLLKLLKPGGVIFPETVS